MRIVLVRVYAYTGDGGDDQCFTAFRDTASAEEWLKAGNFRQGADGSWKNGDMCAECIEMEVV